MIRMYGLSPDHPMAPPGPSPDVLGGLLAQVPPADGKVPCRGPGRPGRARSLPGVCSSEKKVCSSEKRNGFKVTVLTRWSENFVRSKIVEMEGVVEKKEGNRYRPSADHGVESQV